MPELRDMVEKVRSKNAGPFWVTVDIFCGSSEVFADVSARLSTDAVAQLFHCAPGTIKRFDIADLNVIKVSLPRPVVQGDPMDRDMHGAAWGVRVGELEL